MRSNHDERSASSADAFAPGSGTVLLVTRSNRHRRWGRRWLEQCGFVVETAHNVDTALDKLAQQARMTVIVDAGIRDITGQHLFELVLDKRGDDTNVFVLCKSARDLKIAARHERAEILRKPFDWQLIARRVQKTATARRVECELACAYKALEVAKLNAAEAARHVLEMRGVDRLTGLPGRQRFTGQVARVAGEGQDGCAAAVLVVGVNRFDLINDAVGHAAGNDVLHQCAERLHALLEEQHLLSESETTTVTAMAGRVSGARFGLLLSRSDASELQRIARAISTRFEAPFRTDGQSVYLSITIGAATIQKDMPATSNLLAFAEQALEEARVEDVAFRLFDAASSKVHARSLVMEDLLHLALRRQQLRLVYQPIMDWHGRDVLAAEALLRWDHPEAGEILPEEFMSVAERSELVAGINDFVVNEAVRQTAEWAKDRDAPNCVAVNLSYRQLVAGNIVDVVRSALTRYGIEAHRLQIEVRESDLVNKETDVFAVLHRLKGLGVRIAIDQFGTGAFSIALLEQLPLDAVKIERARIGPRQPGRRSDAIGSGMVSIAKRLDLVVTAVGIESEAQVRRLRNWGCDEFQGSLFSEPVAAAELIGSVIPGLKARTSREVASRAADTGRFAVDMRPDSRLLTA